MRRKVIAGGGGAASVSALIFCVPLVTALGSFLQSCRRPMDVVTTTTLSYTAARASYEYNSRKEERSRR